MNFILKGGNVFQTHLKTFIKMDIEVRNNLIYATSEHFENLENFQGSVIDCENKYIIPGLIDIHMHVESSMTYPIEFSKKALPYGVTTVVADPHEIANVFGLEGMYSFMEQETEMDIFYAIPSSVPATNSEMETAGAIITEKEVLELLENPKIICLGEVMNFKDLTSENNTLIKRIVACCKNHERKIPIEGHCPKLPIEDVEKFIFSGVDSDHTQQTAQSVYEKINRGMFIELQKKSLSSEVIEIIKKHNLYERIALVTDDMMPDHLLKSHLDGIIRDAVSFGMPIEQAIYCATWTPALRMHLQERGAIAPGKIADLVILSNLESFKVESVYKNGKLHNKIENNENNYTFPSHFYNSIKCRKAEETDFVLKTDLVENGTIYANVMEISSFGTFTKIVEEPLEVVNNIVKWENSQLCLAAIYERYGKFNSISYGFVKNAFTKKGAVSTSWSHDSHNIFVLGNSPKDMVVAQSKIVKEQGGYCVSKNNEIESFASLNVGGIIYDGPVETLAKNLGEVRESIKNLGYSNNNEIMSISTLSLPVSPEIKLTDKGLFNVRTQERIPLFFKK